MVVANDPILTRFRAALTEIYGDRIERVVLFGSRARGDAQADSDYDVAVFLKDLHAFGKEAGAIAAIEADILIDTGAVINAMPLQAGSHRERTGLMQELRRDGLDLLSRLRCRAGFGRVSRRSRGGDQRRYALCRTRVRLASA